MMLSVKHKLRSITLITFHFLWLPTIGKSGNFLSRPFPLFLVRPMVNEARRPAEPEPSRVFCRWIQRPGGFENFGARQTILDFFFARLSANLGVRIVGFFVVTFSAPYSRPIGLGSLLARRVQPATSIEVIPTQPPELQSRAPQFRLRDEFQFFDDRISISSVVFGLWRDLPAAQSLN